MVEHLPDELQPMAKYAQDVESTDDTGKTLVIRDFVEVRQLLISFRNIEIHLYASTH